MEAVARFIMVAGLILLVLGGLLYAASRLGFPLGALPGDVRVERPGGTIYIPLASSLVISLLLTVLINLIVGILRK